MASLPGRLTAAVLPWLAAAWLAACAAQAPTLPAARLAALAPLIVQTAAEPFQLRGSAQFTFRGNTESGELQVQAEPGPLFRIQLRARVTGSLALDVRFDETDVLVVDYVHESYLLSANTPEVREDLFAVELTPLDFEMALTGRIPAERFRAGGGTRTATEAAFSAAGDEYRFRLDAAGLPSEWIKLRAGQPVVRVEYRSYLELAPGGALPVRLPERIRVYASQPAPQLILGIQEWRLVRSADLAPITFVPPQDVLDRFKPQ